MLEISHVTKKYRDKEALSDVSLTIPQGQIVGLLGENGAGKTTMMKCILGYLRHEGVVTLDGEAIGPGNIHRLSFATCEHSFFPALSPADHRDFYQAHFPAFNDRRFRLLTEFFQLPLHKPLRSFSTGMKNQLEVTLALSQGADYILMDEPFSGSDLFNREDFYRVMLGLLSDHETVILSTHLLEEVKTFLSRAVLLRQGRLIGDISQQEMEEFLTSAVGYPLEKNKRLPSMTANDFYRFCAQGYRAMGYTGTEKSEKEQYALHADGRDEGLSKLDGDSPEAFARWLKERPRTGHPWEVCRGGNSTHIDCIVHQDAHGYYLVVAGLAETRTIEAVRFFLALYRAGVPVCIRNTEELKARLTGAESIGIVPEGVFPAYCHDRFPGESIVDFMNLPRERQDELAKYCRWQPIPVPRMKKEGETP